MPERELDSFSWVESPDEQESSGHNSSTETLPRSVPRTVEMNKDPVVISGFSGRFPESNSTFEFEQNLFNGVDMVTESGRRWKAGMYGLPPRNGQLKDIDRFDASFFGIAPIQADNMDPQQRIILETAYEAIVDAGVNPQSIRGSATGVYVGPSSPEAHEAWLRDPDTLSGYAMTGCTGNMASNRVSFFFDLKGPSYVVESACSSSLLALNLALSDMRAGQCDAAIVIGSGLCMKPGFSLGFQRMSMLSTYGACRSFDASGSGYVRSEAVVALYLQRQPDAKRIYATVVHARNNCDGGKENGITFPSGAIQQRLLEQVYSECGVNPASVSYVEAHGTGTKAGDPQELNAITEVFCTKQRSAPLMVGSVKSNMGHSETASGLCAVAKVLIAMQRQMIPGNLHYKTPNPEIPGLLDGRLHVVAENTPWSGGYVGINSFGFGGTNVHVVLKSANTGTARHAPAAPLMAPVTLPAASLENGTDEALSMRLCTVSGRTKEGVELALKEIQSTPNSQHMQALLQENANTAPTVHPYRGYALINDTANSIDVQKCASPAERQPVWYICTGMGSQWPGMGRELMTIDVCRRSLERSDAVLRQYDFHLCDLIRNASDETYDDIQNTFPVITAIQVAMIDLLHSLGIHPDGIVGHSVGELACAYADGGLTAEEAVLCTYWRGRCVRESSLPPGAMAAVGMTWQEAKERCPPGIVAACHNAIDTVTISGPREEMRAFVKELQAEGTFAKEVNSAGVAFHSYYMQILEPPLRKALDSIIKERRPRTPKWISSSVPEADWDTELAAWSDTDYHCSNIVSPVLFQEALRHVPDNAVTIEIAPHGLLQAILKRSLGTDCVFTSLMKRNHSNNTRFLLENLGKLYMAGVDFSPLKLHAPIKYPVPAGTPALGHLVHWDHSQSWRVPKPEDFVGFAGSGPMNSANYVIDTSASSNDRYLLDHRIDGRPLYPATGYLHLVWRTLAKMHSVAFDKLPVVFEDVHIHQATLLPADGTVTLRVFIHPGSGKFELSDISENVVVTGVVYAADTSEPVLQMSGMLNQKTSAEKEMLKHKTHHGAEPELELQDVYQALRVRGYHYGPAFQIIEKLNQTGTDGSLRWDPDGWIQFLDSLLQVQVAVHNDGLLLPTRIKSIRIDPELHLRETAAAPSRGVPVMYDHTLKVCVSGGVEIVGLHAPFAPRKTNADLATLDEYVFVPFRRAVSVKDGQDYVDRCLDCVQNGLENWLNNNIKLSSATKDALNSCLQKLQQQSRGENKMAADDVSTKKRPLLSLLQEVFAIEHNDAFSANLASVVTSYGDALCDDPLYGRLRQVDSLKPCVDTIIQNLLWGKTLQFVEIGSNVTSSSSSSSPLSKQILPLLNTHLTVKYEYTLVTSSADAVCPDDVDAHIVWDHCKQKIPAEVKAADVIVINQSNFGADLAPLLTALADLKHDDVTLLIHGATANHQLATIVDILQSGDLLSPIDRTADDNFDDVRVIDECAKFNFDLKMQVTNPLLHSLLVFQPRKAANSHRQVDITLTDYEWLPEIQAAMDKNEDLWLMSRDATNPSGVLGLVTCLHHEPGALNIRGVLDLDGSATDADVQQQMERRMRLNVYKDGQWGVLRHLPLKTGVTSPTEHAYIDVLTRGDLSTLSWIESPLKHADFSKQPDIDLCRVAYTSLNFRDIMLASGKLAPDAIPGGMSADQCMLGMEFSGIDSRGHRVMALVAAEALATSVAVQRQYIWPVPDAWSLEEAASVPVVYSTAYYALVLRGQIKQGDRVLIHSGSGGVGQAAIAVALHYGCQVFTTVGSQEKRDYLKARFPQLNDDSFANSRDLSFEWHIKRMTHGEGCDVILNSLAEDKLQASVRCLARHGRFLEIGKVDLANNSELGLAVFLRNVTFHGILLDTLFDGSNARDWAEVWRLVSKGLEQGVVTPLKTTVFDRHSVEPAFRFMAQGKHIGKVVIQVRSDVELRAPMKFDALPKTYCHPNKSYVITGGLGGFGLQLTQWLIDRGARTVILTSRSGVKTGYQSKMLRRWKALPDVKVVVTSRDVSRQSAAEELIAYAQTIAPVGGVFHLAMVLRDGFMSDQTAENFKAVCKSKVQGTAHLDAVTRQSCSSSLDWFVVFSSVASGFGNFGQANYGLANSYMERVCERRQSDGLPGLAIQWGAVGDVGVVLQTMGEDVIVAGTNPQPIASCLTTLDRFLQQSSPVVSGRVIAEKKRALTSSAADAKADLRSAVAHILGVSDVSSINPDMSLNDLGLDSLMGVEVKQVLESNLETVMAMKDIRRLTFKQIGDLQAQSASTPAPTTATKTGDGDATKPVKAATAATTKPAPAATKPAPAASKPAPATTAPPANKKSAVPKMVPLQSTKTAAGSKKRLTPESTLVHMKEAANNVTSQQQQPLFVVHPMEGVVDMLHEVMTSVRGDVYGLQFTSSAPTTTLEDLAAYYIKEVRSVQPQGPYHLCGYSYGACVAIEMCRQLLGNAHKQRVSQLVLLDGSHTYVSTAARHYNLKTEQDKEWQAMRTFVSIFTPVDFVPISAQLKAAPDLASRARIVADYVTSRSSEFDRDDVEQASKRLTRRLLMGDAYRLSPSEPFDLGVTLIKARENEMFAEQRDDYELSEVFSDVEVVSVPGTHSSFLTNASAVEVAGIINAKRSKS